MSTEEPESTPTAFLPIDATGGAQPILSGLSPLEPGVLVADRFRLIEPHGRLGFASRWDAKDEARGTLATVLAMANDAEAAPIVEAARQASIVMDPRFLVILDAGPDADSIYVVFEGVNGKTLSEVVASGPLTAREAAWVTREVAAALAKVHAMGFFHLRLNPNDIIITRTGLVKISGLMVEAACTPQQGDERFTNGDKEKQDTLGIGRILYTCLTSRWPGDPIAGVRSVDKSGDGIPSPSQIQPGTSGPLNKLTYRILAATAPGHLTTAKAVQDVLDSDLGTSSATGELAQRVTAEVVPAEPLPASEALTPTIAMAPPVTKGTGTDGSSTDGPPPHPAAHSQPPASVPDNGVHRPTILPEGHPDAPILPPSLEVPPAADHGGTVPRPPVTSSNSHAHDLSSGDDTPIKPPHSFSAAQVKRWSVGLILLVGLVVVTLITTLVIGLYRGSAAADNTPVPKTIPIMRAVVFDPDADGGNDTENDALAPLSYDGDPTTVWPTANYAPGYIPDRKKGVGLIYDLGSIQTVSSMTFSTTILPTAFTLYVPVAEQQTMTSPPVDTIASWQEVTSTSVTETTVSLSFEPKQTRYILVFLTVIQPGSDGQWRGDISEVTFSD